MHGLSSHTYFIHLIFMHAILFHPHGGQYALLMLQLQDTIPALQRDRRRSTPSIRSRWDVEMSPWIWVVSEMGAGTSGTLCSLPLHIA